MMVNGVTSLAAGELLPHVVYLYRKHPAQMTASPTFDDLEGPARQFAFNHGRHLRDAITACSCVGSEIP
ncbi:hypothetical protein ACZ90_20155 [Streptomyces albus subsp. albus]|nr:hypothetical protein ACZ90_20155 [Streptomyces albus subsp. albus]